MGVEEGNEEAAMEQASAIYQAESAEEARQRLTAFAQQWRARTPLNRGDA